MLDLESIQYGQAPAILIFADDPGCRDRIGAMIEGAGGRVSAALDLAQAAGRIADHAAPDGVVIDFSGAHETIAEALFRDLANGARNQRFRSVAFISENLIDLAVAHAYHSDIQLLCASSLVDETNALAALVAGRTTMLNDIGAETGQMQLRELSEEVGRIARVLATLSARPMVERSLFQGSCEDNLESMIDAPAIRALIRARRLRDSYFQAELFADPAWDMLLDLMASRLEGQPVAVSSLCIAAAVPPTTALRWIKAMTELGLLERTADPNDGRRVFIDLTPRATDAMLGYLSAVRRVSAYPI